MDEQLVPGTKAATILSEIPTTQSCRCAWLNVLHHACSIVQVYQVLCAQHCAEEKAKHTTRKVHRKRIDNIVDAMWQSKMAGSGRCNANRATASWNEPGLVNPVRNYAHHKRCDEAHKKR